MTAFSPLISQLIQGLCALPGIGPKSAQRIAFHLLERNRDAGLRLAQALQESMTQVKHCTLCRNFSDTDICTLCANPNRDPALLCVVETPADVAAIEQTVGYRGYYFVLQGRLSPLDGIGPRELGIDKLLERIQNQGVTEVILATNSTVEGEVTAHHIAKLLQPLSIKTTRIAQGVPMGGELEFADSQTLYRALASRTVIAA